MQALRASASRVALASRFGHSLESVPRYKSRSSRRTFCTFSPPAANYDFKTVEERVKSFWAKQDIYKRAKAQTDPKKKFFFVDGPPYTSGKVHLGTAWNKSLKDLIIRQRRMNGFTVWDRPGYDMHGLPTEKATEKKLGISSREDIYKMGVEKYIEECRSLCISNMNDMTKVFKDMGVWMDWDDPYISIDRDYMEGEWWLIKKIHDLGRLYEGEKTMTWDAVNGTALAKHELVYDKVIDEAIYVEFKLINAPPEWEGTSLVVWTTTPWTIPFNLAVMVHPEINYCKVSFTSRGTRRRIVVAKALLQDFLEEKMKLAPEEYTIESEFMGSTLEGLSYKHPFDDVTDKYRDFKTQMPRVHTVLLNSDFVTTEVGTGLVHVAPGCGPEDYVVGQKAGIKPFNAVNVTGVYENFAPFDGLLARKDDPKFIQLIKDQGALVFKHKYEHDYPFGERSKEPVIYRTTKQWFFRVEDTRPKLIDEHHKINWLPDAAANSFGAWLENLRDNSISKQRYWGTPVPIWRNEDDPSDYVVVGSVKELVELAKLDKAPEDIHIPTVDKIVLKLISKKDGKEHNYVRVPDVLDVWVDAGTASFNVLRYPAQQSEEFLKEWFPMAFILEGKDQIRGWFNLLHVLSVLVFDQRSFNNCYMHGFINDSMGRKMSKSIGNYIIPEEVTTKYGNDVMRYYMTGGANPGLDLNYNFKDLDVKYRNTTVFWNLHKWLFDTAEAAEVDLVPLEQLITENPTALSMEEKYVLSRLQSTILEVSEHFDQYRLNETPGPIERFLVDTLSHTYLQLVWEKASLGTEEEKKAVLSVVHYSLTTAMTLMAPVMPFFTEEVYQNLKKGFPTVSATLAKEDSVHLRSWPVARTEWIDEQLENDLDVAKDAITAILAGRDRLALGTKWPLQEVRITATQSSFLPSLKRCEDLILKRTNVKSLNFEPPKAKIELKANTKLLGKKYGSKTPALVKLIDEMSSELAKLVEDPAMKSKSIRGKLEQDDIEITEEFFTVRRSPPQDYVESSGVNVQAFLDTRRTPELDHEGYVRELVRRIQMVRKTMGLKRRDRINLEISVSDAAVAKAVHQESKFVLDRVGVSELVVREKLGVSSSAEHKASGSIKQLQYELAASLVK